MAALVSWDSFHPEERGAMPCWFLDEEPRYPIGTRRQLKPAPRLQCRRAGAFMNRLFTAWLVLSAGLPAPAARVDFNRDIRPVMSDTCFRCHGFDANARKARLRLDIREDALKPAKSGLVPIVPGKPDESEMIRRLFSEDPEAVMPPPELHKPLTAEQKNLFRRWIAEGAEYRGHWALLAPARPALPRIQNPEFRIRNAIDAFIGQRLEERGLQPPPQADKATLIRRVSLDLTGLPPRLDEVDAFLADTSSNAYEHVVDHLLASPHYGERMAQDWLDAARFADSNGYQVDRDREMWAWRDWVIDAFNRNLPFDQFTIEQFAGDLLPNPTIGQRIATGFHRNHMINEEGGIIPEEFLAEYCSDRVETTATVWLGLTFTCARCHDHKYDPITQRDYYSLLAFFHNVPEKGVGDYGANIRRSTPPFLKLPAPELEAKLTAAQRELEVANQQLTNLDAALIAGVAEWEHRALGTDPAWKEVAIRQASFASNGPPAMIAGGWVEVPGSALTNKLTIAAQLPAGELTALRIEVTATKSESRGTNPTPGIAELKLFKRATNGSAERKLLTLRAAALPDTVGVGDWTKALDQKAETVWTVSLTNDQPVAGILLLSEPLATGDGDLELEMELPAAGSPAPWRCRVRATSVAAELLVPSEVLAVLRKPVAERSAEERKQLEEFRFARSHPHEALTQRVAQVRQQVEAADLAIPITLVMAEMDKPRPTFVLKRGAYDKPGEEVSAATPSALPPFPADLPRTRLGLARWLTDPANPLTARVMVNRLWQSAFGTGLVRTAEDFGVQGELPSHPELLDWLATEFVSSGWNVKSMMRLLVTSATYRQDSRASSEIRAMDPDNRLLARGPRHRLSAEVIRDQALAVSGLLLDPLGGPSVKPYHPPGLYEQVVAGSSADTYKQDHGPSLYRRTLYTYWKRSVPNPALLLFDMPLRETCAVRRARTTTPLQALDLLNDPTYVEAARALGQRMIREGGSSAESRLQLGFRFIAARSPRPRELEVLIRGLQRAMATYRADPAGAAELLRVGESKPDGSIEAAELAAYTTVASTLLNLDEAVTRE
jgi:hypothetical protein